METVGETGGETSGNTIGKLDIQAPIAFQKWLTGDTIGSTCGKTEAISMANSPTSPTTSHTLGAAKAHNPTRRWTETRARAILPWQEIAGIFATNGKSFRYFQTKNALF